MTEQLEHDRAAEDEQLMRIVRGIAAVNRAVKSFEQRKPGDLDALVPVAVARRLGWTVCSRCGRPLSPGWCIQRGSERFHPSCTLVVLSRAA